MKRIMGFMGSAALVLLAIVLSEVPVIREAARMIDEYRQPLLFAAVGLAACGFALFMGGVLSMLMASGTPMTHDQIEGAISQRQGIGEPAVWRSAAHRVFGPAAGQQGSYEASFAGVKDAWATGEWRRDPLWRRFFMIALGAMMLGFGMFGAMIAAGPNYLKVLLFGALAYATFMTARGLARA